MATFLNKYNANINKTMKITIQEFATRAKRKRNAIHKLIRDGKIIPTLGIGKNKKPCYFIDLDVYSPIKHGRAKRGRPVKK